MEDSQEVRTPEEAVQAIAGARESLNEAYTKIIHVAIWASLALENYQVTGIVSQKQPMLHVIDTRSNEYEEQWYELLAKLNELEDAVVAVGGKGDSV